MSIFAIQGSLPNNGKQAEQRVVQFLKRQPSTKIIARNYCEHTGEIDVIANQIDNMEKITLFIEIKYRHCDNYDRALQAVDYNKQQRLRRTATLWLQKHDPQLQFPCRFDVIALYTEGQQLKLYWLKNAF